MNVIDALTFGQAQVMRTVDRFGEDHWSRIALGVWTVKDLVGHLGAFEVRFADILAGFVGVSAQTTLLAADPATFNDDQAAVRADWSFDAVVAEFLAAHERSITYARDIPTARWAEVGTIPWYGPQYALDDLVVYTIYGHKREHEPQLTAVLDASTGRDTGH